MRLVGAGHAPNVAVPELPFFFGVAFQLKIFFKRVFLTCTCSHRGFRYILALLPFLVNYAKILVLLYSNIEYGKVLEWLEETRLRLSELEMLGRRRPIGSQARSSRMSCWWT